MAAAQRTGSMSLRDALEDADRRRHAVGHFNVSDLVALRAARLRLFSGLDAPVR
jgi:hypothetical protein